MMQNIIPAPRTLLAMLFIVVFSLTACEREPDIQKISLSDVETEQNITTAKKGEDKPLRVAVAAIISPKQTFIYYKEILNYISMQAGIPVNLVLRETYQEINELVRKNELDLAFICSGAYVDGHRDFGMELLVAPVAYGKSTYNSYIIVPKNSNINSLEDLRGKRFAFTDPMSNTGKLAPTSMLAQINETPDSFFGSYTFTYSHDRSIEAVAQQLVDGAAVDSLVWDYLNSNNPQHTSLTRIIKTSKPYGIPPVVIPKELEPHLKQQLKKILLDMHNNEDGRAILAKVMIDRFTEIDDKAYDSIRTMQEQNAEK